MMRIILCSVPIDQRVMSEGVHRDPILGGTGLEPPMRQDELRRIAIIAEVSRKRRSAHSDFDVFSDLQMQMRVV